LIGKNGDQAVDKVTQEYFGITIDNDCIMLGFHIIVELDERIDEAFSKFVIEKY
jgi:hypothetical protein